MGKLCWYELKKLVKRPFLLAALGVLLAAALLLSCGLREYYAAENELRALGVEPGSQGSFWEFTALGRRSAELAAPRYAVIGGLSEQEEADFVQAMEEQYGPDVLTGGADAALSPTPEMTAVPGYFPQYSDWDAILTYQDLLGRNQRLEEQLHGENTPEKSAWVQADYAACLETISRQEAMQQEYSAGELTEEEWAAYQQELNDAYLHRNASKLFTETAQRFAEQSPDLAPAHYLYEYGWETIFTLQQWPDVFLLGWLLLLAVQCFSQETASGMLPVLLAARNGRGRLFGAKLAVLLAAGLCGAAASSLLEAGIFLARGFCNDPGAPLYSVAAMDNCGLPLSLAQGYLLSLGIRGAAALLFAAGVFALSQWLRQGAYLIFAGLCLVSLPLLWDSVPALFLYGGAACGSRALLWAGRGAVSLWLPLCVMAAYTAGLTALAARRYRRGL